MNHQSNNPLHGKTLEAILNELVEKIGWKAMGENVDIRCFNNDPSIKSSLKFLRRTPWARTKVEAMYLNVFHGFRWPDTNSHK
ncbi:VF530 family protein [Thalassotalea sediminis]|uniref:VF530 family protein n=1 Tax=Thalassotalea sediminis TaxID=1759089 RepID=UPI0025726198|nr:VF530 family protein [Thalassotalea sediminis]